MENESVIQEPVSQQQGGAESFSPAPVANEVPQAIVGNGIDESSIPPELQGTYSKLKEGIESKYKDYEEVSKRAKAFDEIVKNPQFQQWYTSLGQKQQQQPQEQEGKEQEISDEEYANILTDKTKFNNFIQSQVVKMAQQLVAPEIAKTRNQVELFKVKEEIKSFANDHKDFWELDQKGLIEPVFSRYPGIGIEDAYKIAKFDTLRQESVNRAHGIVNSKKASFTERPGMPNNNMLSKVKVKNREEAMNIAWEHALAGRQPPDFEYVK